MEDIGTKDDRALAQRVFILSGVPSGMGVSTENSEEPQRQATMRQLCGNHALPTVDTNLTPRGVFTATLCCAGTYGDSPPNPCFPLSRNRSMRRTTNHTKYTKGMGWAGGLPAQERFT